MKGGGKLALVRDEIEVGRADLGQVPEDLGLAVALLDRLTEMIKLPDRGRVLGFLLISRC